MSTNELTDKLLSFRALEWDYFTRSNKLGADIMTDHTATQNVDKILGLVQAEQEQREKQNPAR